MRAYSMDLRERVFRDSDAGMTSVAVAEKYDVSRAWVDRLKQRRRGTRRISSFSMKPASRRISCAGTAAARAASASAIMRRARAGRRAPLSPACGSPD
jgi:transposase-like protein